ncbi:hypothetical protein Y032_0558g3412 [Ancylostoma ceylanicum]|uniref:Uncharacterized protein n=1 Tax=Ancylostoma ceylanicum TaxID=53326 RepID=A0A016WQ60_9BILA|nr:hypothetical protein Y032_0558g3412 [Ancylostoma ceylanicum]
MPYTPLVSWLRSILGNESRCISPFLTWERHLTALPRIIWLPPFRGQIFPSPLVYSRLRPLPLQCGEGQCHNGFIKIHAFTTAVRRRCHTWFSRQAKTRTGDTTLE